MFWFAYVVNWLESLGKDLLLTEDVLGYVLWIRQPWFLLSLQVIIAINYNLNCLLMNNRSLRCRTSNKHN